MPRAQAASSSTKTLRRRSHRGCTRCRSHKIRCDESRPRCGSCVARGHMDCCFGVLLKWEADYVGKAFGRAGVWSKNGKRKTQAPALSDNSYFVKTLARPYGFLNVFTDDICGDEERPPCPSLAFQQPVLPSQIDPAILAFQLAGPHWQLPSLFGQECENHLLSYYLNRVCPLSIPYPNQQSPFASLLFPLASSSSPAILDAMLGIAASHRARFEPKFQAIALAYATQATRSLRLSLQSNSQLEIALNTEALVLMMLLCQFEVTQDCDSKWVVHLRGARDLIRLRRRQIADSSRQQVSSCSTTAILKFVERYFAFCDVMGRTACGEEPIFGNDFWSTQEDELDIWMGCSPRTVSIVSVITELSWKYRGRDNLGDEEMEELRRERLRLGLALQHPANESDDLDDVMRAGIELKRLTVQLYLYSALDDTTPSSACIQEGVQQILRLVFVLLQAGVCTGLTWPLFMAACQLDPQEELQWAVQDMCTNDDIPKHARAFILYALDQLNGSLSNVMRTRHVIEKIWIGREFQASKNTKNRAEIGRLKVQCLNDWATFIAPYSHNISLV